MRIRGYSTLVAVVLLFTGTIATGCAQRADNTTAPKAGAGYPLTAGVLPGKPVTLPSQPRRIVSLDPATTENLFAIGAGKQIVAADATSDFPANAPKTAISALKPNIEAITKYHPDLVIGSIYATGLAASLQKLKIPLLQVGSPTTLDQTYSWINTLGKVTGHAASAADIANRMRSDIDKLVADTPKPRTPLSYYYEVDQTFYTATSKTFIGSVLGKFGLTNIADPADTPATAGYPQLSAEIVVKDNPALIFLADTKCCGQSTATIAKRPGFANLKAVHDGGVIPLEDDIASRWTPRLVDLVRATANAVTAAEKH